METQETIHQFLGMTAVIASEPMFRLMETVERVARSPATVLITGESGVGKEVIARALHARSGRVHRPWVDLSCAAVPEPLLESELFGHEKGAFSGADTSKPGLFELAHQGTIFLDEIGDLDARLQVKLLRVLDGAPYYRLGGLRKVSVDVRIVAATNQDLEAAVADGRFRGDLFHRLNQVNLHVPPLRERVAEIEPLARFFLQRHDPRMRLTPGAVALLESHPWPGNIRELRNAVVQAAVLAGNAELRAEDFRLRQLHPVLPHKIPMEAASRSLKAMERRLILEALDSSGGHQQKAAAALGISRRTLSRKLRQYRGRGLGVTS
jgi:DNA-binding NtrC family response regulator